LELLVIFSVDLMIKIVQLYIRNLELLVIISMDLMGKIVQLYMEYGVTGHCQY